MMTGTMDAKGTWAWVIAACVTLVSGWAGAADWYQQRGPENNGISREVNLPEKWSPKGENLVWSNKVGGICTPIVMRGRVYVTGRVGEDQVDGQLLAGPRTQEALICIDGESGKPVWEYRQTPAGSHVSFENLGASGAAGDPETGRVYAVFADGTLICVEGADGKLVWRRQLGEEFGVVLNEAPFPAVLVDEDRVLVTAARPGWLERSLWVAAFEKASGEVVWTYSPESVLPEDDATVTSPFVTSIDGQRAILIVHPWSSAFALQARTGKLMSFAFGCDSGFGTAVVSGPRAYITRVGPKGKGDVHCADLSKPNGETVWYQNGACTAPLVVDGWVYVVNEKGFLRQLSAGDGKEQWQTSIGGGARSAPVWGDGKLYVASADGVFSIFKPGEKSCEVLSRVELREKPGRAVAIGGSPAIANGRVYLQTAGGMYCIGPRQSSVKPATVPARAASSLSSNPTQAQIVPADLLLNPGEIVRLRCLLHDAKGNPAWFPTTRPTVTRFSMRATYPTRATTRASTQPTANALVQGDLGTVFRNFVFVAGDGWFQAGQIAMKVNDLEAIAFVRIVPPLPWKIDVDEEWKSPPIFVGAPLNVRNENGRRVLVRDDPLSTCTYFGRPDMANYTLRANLKLGASENEGGVINSRYVLALVDGGKRLRIHVWPGGLPRGLTKSVDFAWKANRWYAMKLRVDQTPENAVIRGKAWPAGEAEPEAWTIEMEDTNQNRSGAPGFYGDAKTGEVLYDAIVVTDNQK